MDHDNSDEDRDVDAITAAVPVEGDDEAEVLDLSSDANSKAWLVKVCYALALPVTSARQARRVCFVCLVAAPRSLSSCWIAGLRSNNLGLN